MSNRIALIDADSIIYIVAWNHKDSEESLVVQAVDSIIESILKKVDATHYLVALSSEYNFRTTRYKYAEYKGNRGPKPEWVVQWSGVIKAHLKEHHKSVAVTGLEADDILSVYKSISPEVETLIYCSPDKDLMQIPGYHFNYKQLESAEIVEVDEFQAYKYLYTQLLMGDTVDNIKGIPNLGPVKAQKFLEQFDFTTNDGIIDAAVAIETLYSATFGEYYGPIIFKETLDTVSLLTPMHYYWDGMDLQQSGLIRTLPYSLNPVPSLGDLSDLPSL